MNPPSNVPPSSSPRHSAAGHSDRGAVESALARAAAGDPRALSELHRSLNPGLVRHFLRLVGGHGAGGREAAAEELAQQTWIAFSGALREGKYDPSRARLSTFLYAISSNIYLRHLRASGRAAERRTAALHADEPGPEGLDPSKIAANAAEIERVRRAIAGQEPGAKLSDDEREVLRLVAAGRSDRELALYLACSASTANMRKQVALGKLRAFLERDGNR